MKTTEKQRERSREYYYKNRKKVLERVRLHYQGNIEDTRRRAREYAKIYGLTPIGRYHRLKSNVRQRGKVALLISRDEFVEWFKRQDSVCYYCGQPLAVKGESQLNTMTCDRKNNNESYTIGNIVLACWRCNVAKGSWLSEAEMLEIANKYFRGKVAL